MADLTNVAAIREYMQKGKHGRKVEMAELKELSPAERVELGDMCKTALAENWD